MDIMCWKVFILYDGLQTLTFFWGEALATGSRWPASWQEKHKEVEGICAPIVSKYYGGGGAGNLTTQKKVQTFKYWKEIRAPFAGFGIYHDSNGKQFAPGYSLWLVTFSFGMVLRNKQKKWAKMEDWIGSLLSHKGVFFKLQPETGKDTPNIGVSKPNLLVLGKWTLGWCPKEHYVSVASSTIPGKFQFLGRNWKS